VLDCLKYGTNHKALFVHIVAVLGLYLMLLHLSVQEIKVQLVASEGSISAKTVNENP
jgi:hypothetical protein